MIKPKNITRNPRKEVDNFLVHLNLFMRKNSKILTEDNIFDLILPIKAVLPSSFAPTDELELQSLVSHINNTTTRNKTKTRRKSSYIRRCWYKVEYQIVKWESYDEIFTRLLKNKNELIEVTWLILNNFYENNPAEEFIIPKDYWKINNDRYYSGDYKII